MKSISPLEQAYTVIEHYFTEELGADKLLSDVNTFLTSESTRDHIEAPILWFEKEKIEPTNSAAFNDETYMDISFNLVCCNDIVDDFSQAENDSLNLVSRCLTCLFMHINSPHEWGENVKVRGFTINSIDPVGTFQIVNKTNVLPASRVSLTFHVAINWMLYIEDDSLVDYGDTGEDEFDDVIFDVAIDDEG